MKLSEKCACKGLFLLHDMLKSINTRQIPGKLSHENMISSQVKRSPLPWLHNKSIFVAKVKWFVISLVFM